MRKLNHLRALRLPFQHRDGEEPDYAELLDNFYDVVETVREAYPSVQPSPAFRDALHARLMAEAAWLKDHPVASPRAVAVKRSALAAAALLLAGLAVLAWRSTHSQAAPGQA